jgi:hypothetical protein
VHDDVLTGDGSPHGVPVGDIGEDLRQTQISGAALQDGDVVSAAGQPVGDGGAEQAPPTGDEDPLT